MDKARLLEALKGSIDKWHAIVLGEYGAEADRGGDNEPLCGVFCFNCHDDDDNACPLGPTGDCGEWTEWSRHHQMVHREEYDDFFLERRRGLTAQCPECRRLAEAHERRMIREFFRLKGQGDTKLDEDRTLRALEESKAKWGHIIDGSGDDQGGRTCALCQEFSWSCQNDVKERCPLWGPSGACRDYNAWRDHQTYSHTYQWRQFIGGTVQGLKVHCPECLRLAGNIVARIERKIADRRPASKWAPPGEDALRLPVPSGAIEVAAERIVEEAVGRFSRESVTLSFKEATKRVLEGFFRSVTEGRK